MEQWLLGLLGQEGPCQPAALLCQHAVKPVTLALLAIQVALAGQAERFSSEGHP